MEALIKEKEESMSKLEEDTKKLHEFVMKLCKIYPIEEIETFLKHLKLKHDKVDKKRQDSFMFYLGGKPTEEERLKVLHESVVEYKLTHYRGLDPYDQIVEWVSNNYDPKELLKVEWVEWHKEVEWVEEHKEYSDSLGKFYRFSESPCNNEYPCSYHKIGNHSCHLMAEYDEGYKWLVVGKLTCNKEDMIPSFGLPRLEYKKRDNDS
jgi:hypothetical protein